MSDDKKEFTPQGETEIRQQVVEEYGLDPNEEANKPFIEKAVKKELDWQNEKLELSKKEKTWEQELADRDKKLSKAIEQKKQWREKASKVLQEDDDDANNGELNPTGKPAPKTEHTEQKSVENEKLSSLEKEIAELKGSQQRQKYSHLTDEEYNAINSLAKADGKSFEDTMNSNPLAKTYLETNKVNQRIASNTIAPSTRTNPSGSINFDQIDLDNPEHTAWLKADPKRRDGFAEWLEKNKVKLSK